MFHQWFLALMNNGENCVSGLEAVWFELRGCFGNCAAIVAIVEKINPINEVGGSELKFIFKTIRQAFAVTMGFCCMDQHVFWLGIVTTLYGISESWRDRLDVWLGRNLVNWDKIFLSGQ